MLARQPVPRSVAGTTVAVQAVRNQCHRWAARGCTSTHTRCRQLPRGRSVCTNSAALPVELPPSAGDEGSKQGAWAQKWAQWWAVVPDQKSDTFVSTPDVFKELLLLSSPNTLWLAIGFVALIVGAACDLAIPHFVSKTFEAVINAVSGGVTASTPLNTAFSWANFMQTLQLSPQLQTTLLGLVCVSAGQAVLYAVRGVCFSLINYRVVRDLRAKLFRRLVAQDVLYFNETGHDAAGLSSRLASDCLSVSRLITMNLNIALRNGLQAVGGIAYLFWLNQSLALGCLATAGVMCIISIRNGVFQRKAMSAIQSAVADSTSVAEEALSSMRLVRSHGYEANEEKRYFAKVQRVVDIGVRSTAAYGLYMLTHITTWHVANIFILAVGGAYALAGVISPAQLTAFVMYSDHVLAACLAVCEQIAAILENIGSADAVLKMVQLPESKQVSSGVVPGVDAWEGGMQVQDVTFTYPPRGQEVPGQGVADPAVRGVSLDLQIGSTTALVGKSGSGKSTLVQLLTRQVDPDSGRIALAGRSLTELDSAWFRSCIAIVPQEPRLFSTTVFENIAYGAEQPSMAAVEAAAKAANAHDFILELPLGYATEVSDNSLSGGQRQRIGIARALVRNPKFLVLDEATSALDASSEAAVQSAIEQIMADRSRTVVIVAHRLSTVRSCDKIVVMDQGSVAEWGTHRQLMQRRWGIYHGLVTQQQRGHASTDDAVDPAPHEGSEKVVSDGPDCLRRAASVDEADVDCQFDEEINIANRST